jgi:hypothetical protein
MYLHKAMKAPDTPQFREAMQKEIDYHTSHRHREIVSRASLPT